MKTLKLARESGAKAEVCDYGAHVIRWANSAGREWLFLSSKALFQPGKAIRGGVPVIFPQFNEFGSGKRHGFARLSQWEHCDGGDNGDHQVMLRLTSNSSTRQIWPCEFTAHYQVALQGDELSMTLTVENTDAQPIEFTAALHTYLKVNNFPDIKITGFQGKEFWDNGAGPFTERLLFKDYELAFDDAIDRVYFNVDHPLTLTDGVDQLGINMSGFRDVVVWNPGAEGAEALGDMDDQEYRQMVCVEAAVIDQPVRLGPGEKWQGSQVLQG
ncbi:MAG: D-hexose-6-phosphate mutarotase [Ketobacteraceae bacterium]|nr:D-hexose-6-phosphate mutarotase [Ketobacteraceae bacterium]